MLKPHQANDDVLFPAREPKRFYDFGMPDDLEWQVDEIVGHRWDGDQLMLLVHWTVGEHTWEAAHVCDDLKALDDYLGLLGVARPDLLPRRERDASASAAGQNKH